MFFITEEAKETILDFHKETWEYYKFSYALIKYLKKITQYTALNVKLSNSSRDKLKSWIKYGTEVNLLKYFKSFIKFNLMMRLIFHIDYYRLRKILEDL